MNIQMWFANGLETRLEAARDKNIAVGALVDTAVQDTALNHTAGVRDFVGMAEA